MKKKINIIAFLSFCIFLFTPSISISQLSGTYTIGGTSPNYSTVIAAVNALNTQGISNSVVFNIRPGTYTGQITINSVSGASASKTITFQSENGDSTSVIVSHTSSTSNTNNFTLRLNNTDYVYFKNITIERTGTETYNQVIDISNGATYNKFINCRIIGFSGVSTATYSALIGSTSSADDSYNEFISNLFEGGSYGLYYLGRGSTMLDLGLKIKNNIFNNQYYRAMHITAQSSAQITGNQINALSASSSYQGIYAFYCDNALRILKNKININNGGYAIYIHNSSGSATEKGLIANNFVSLGGNAEANGIYINLSSAQHIYYNSFNLYSNNNNSKVLYINGAITANIDIRNNNFYSSGNAYAIYVSSTTVNPIASCNYNNLYTSGNYVGFWKSIGDVTDLSAWKLASGFDNNSVSTDPLYVSITDLHAQSGVINNAGTSSLSSATPVTDDIDNQSRNITNPDIGADEFSVEDLGISSLIINDTVCINSSSNVDVYIKNYGSFAFSGSVSVYYQYASEPIVNEATTLSNLNPNDSVLYSFNNTIIHNQTGQNTLIAGTNLNNDINTNNDESSIYNIEVKNLPLTYVNNDTIMCANDSLLLNASGGISYNWSNGNTSNQIFVKPTSPSIYYVTVTDNYGCISHDSVNIDIFNSVPVISDFSYNINGLYVTLTNNSINADNYLWLFGNGNSDTSFSPSTLFYPDSGYYDITLFSYNNCYIDSVTYNIYVTKVNEFNNSENLNIFPNPANDYVCINYSISDNNDLIISIKSINGVLQKEIITNKSSSTATIDISFLSKGIYIIEAKTNKYYGQQILIKL